MSHLGQRLSALIDGELDSDERDRVLGHLARCGWCREEASALRTLKRRMNALGETVAGAGLTGRLMGLSGASHSDAWPQSAAGWPAAGSGGRSDGRAAVSRYFLAGSLAVFLAGLGTAAFIAGGDPQAPSPTPKVTPSVDVFLLEHEGLNDIYMNGLVPQNAGPGNGDSSSKNPYRPLP